MDLVGATHGAVQFRAAKQALRLNPRSPELAVFVATVIRP
jgi:hypothetical protein